MQRTQTNVFLYAAAQVFTATAAGLSLTIATVAASRIAESDAIGGLAQTSMIVGASGITVVVAGLARRRGRRTSLQAAYGMALFGSLGASLGSHLELWPVLLVGLFFVGGGTVASLALRFAASDGVAARERSIVISYILGAATFGSLIGPNLVSLVGGSTAVAFLLNSSLYVCAGVVVSFVRISMKHPSPQGRGFSLALLRDRRIARGIAANALAQAVMVALMSMAPVHLDHAGMIPGVIGAVMSAHLVSMYALSPVFGHLVARRRPATVLSLGGLLLLVAAVVLTMANGRQPDLWLFGLGLVLLGLGWSSTLVAGSALVSESAMQDERIAAQGMSDLSMNVAGGLASMIGGLAMALWGYQALALSGAAIVVVFLLASFAIGSPGAGKSA